MEWNCHKFESRPAVHVFGSCAPYVSRGLPKTCSGYLIYNFCPKHTHTRTCTHVLSRARVCVREWVLVCRRQEQSEMAASPEFSWAAVGCWLVIPRLLIFYFGFKCSTPTGKPSRPKTSTPRAGVLCARGLVPWELGARPREIRTCRGVQGEKTIGINKQLTIFVYQISLFTFVGR